MNQKADLVKYVREDYCLINGVPTHLIDHTGEELPLVTVTMITYNHEKYLGQAIEGVISQITNFKFVLLIGDDCSTDRTREIAIQYQKRCPHIIILKLPENNLGVMENSVSNKLLSRGKYIAENEGDDYWTDPYKLQKQVDFLEVNPDYVLCYHDSKVVDNNASILNSSLVGNKKKDYSQEELQKGAWIPTLTRCFRNVIKIYPSSMLKVSAGDLFLTSVLGNYGKAKYLDFNGAAYRQHHQGVWTSLNKIEVFKKNICDFKLISKFYKSNNQTDISHFYDDKIKKTISKIHSTSTTFSSFFSNILVFKFDYLNYLIYLYVKKIVLRFLNK